MSKAKEIIDIFEQEEQPSFPGMRGGRLEPLVGSFEFLKMVKNPDELARRGYSELKLPSGTGEIWISGEPEIIINYDSKKMIKDYMYLDKKLTKQIQKDFEDYEGGSWAHWRKKWLNKRGWKEYGSGNTYNEDNYYFWGSVFEWTSFETDKGEQGAIIMWHRGGDVRGNYDLPEVWIGDFDEFYSSQDVGDPEEEISYIMGYEGDKDALMADIKKWKEENYKGKD